MNSKITTAIANSILEDIFGAGNYLALSTTDPNSSFTEPTASSYERYKIQVDDFEADEGVITNKRHLLYGLATEAWGTIVAFGVYNTAKTLIYWGLLTSPVEVPIDHVPVFKIYNETAGEGIKVTLDAVETTSASV